MATGAPMVGPNAPEVMAPIWSVAASSANSESTAGSASSSYAAKNSRSRRRNKGGPTNSHTSASSASATTSSPAQESASKQTSAPNDTKATAADTKPTATATPAASTSAKSGSTSATGSPGKPTPPTSTGGGGSSKGGGVAQIKVAAHYSCRTRNNRPGAKISEHGKGKAIDISGFRLRDGTEITVLKDYDSWQFGPALRRMRREACGPFGTVLGPGSDRYHNDHFHFDTARHRGGAYCR